MFKKFAFSTTAAVLVTGLMISAGASTAEAGNGWRTGAAVAGGFVAGAVVGSALSRPHYAPRPPHVRYRPAPRHVHYRPAPWTPAWYRYCSSKYRSFNPNTGYFVAYSGHRKFCR